MDGFKQIAPGMYMMEASLVNRWITELEELRSLVKDVKNSEKKWLTAQDVMDATGFGKTWLNDNKHVIGCSTIGGCLRFKRSDVDAFIEANYFKVKSKTSRP